jgi:hypothetical protein
MPLILGTNSIKDTGFDVANSCRFDAGSSSYMSKSLGTGSTTNATISMWFKRGKLVQGDLYQMYDDGSNLFRIRLSATYIQLNVGASGADIVIKTTSRFFRDVSAWYHLVVAIDLSDSTAENKIKLYINGIRETSFSTNTNTTTTSGAWVGGSSDYTLNIGREPDNTDFFDGYMSEVVFIDGTTLDATSFGEFDEDSGIWKPIDVSGLTFGTNGFYLDFKDSANLGNDANGGTDFTESGLAAVDQSTDTCTNNFATLNPLYVGLNANFGLSEGNLKGLNSGAGENNYVSNFGVSSGKWYVEAKATMSGNAYGTIGIVATDSVLQTNGSWLGSTNDSWYYSQNGHIGTNGGSTSTGHATYTTGDIISVALNLDDNELLWYKNGAVQNSGTATSITANKTYFIGGRVYDTSTGWEFNFGSPPFAISSGNSDGNGYGNFEYAVPENYYSLNVKNLAEYG